MVGLIIVIIVIKFPTRSQCSRLTAKSVAYVIGYVLSL